MRITSIRVLPVFVLVVAVISTCLFQLPLSAQSVEALTAKNLRDACDNLVLAVRGVRAISQEDPGAMLCFGYLAGWSQAMEMVPDKPYCLPEVAVIQPGDVADLLVAFIDEHPESHATPAHETILKAFTGAFPCIEESDSETEGDPQ